MIIRAKHDKKHPFTRISNEALRDPRLSWKAKGLLTFILSNKSNWKIWPKELSNHAKDGLTSTMSALRELIRTGYIERKQDKSQELQQFKAVEYVVNELPDPCLLLVVSTRNPQSGNRVAAQEDNIFKLQQFRRGERGNYNNPEAVETK